MGEPILKIIAGADIRITDPTEAIVNYCKANLVIQNPEYAKKERLNKYTGDTPREIWLYQKTPDGVVLPSGCIDDVWQVVSDASHWSTDFSRPRSVKFESAIELYPYQEEALKRIMVKRNGVVIMPCGSGKTQTAIEAICRIGLPALWITHTSELLNQSMSRMVMSACTMPNFGFGTITGGKIDVGTHITFATIQTLSKIDLAPYKDFWGVVVVDECHHAIGAPTRTMMFYSVLSKLSARYKIGLTATPERADGMERAMFALLGNTIYSVDKSQLSDRIVPIHVMGAKTDYSPDMKVITDSAGIIDHAKALTLMALDEDRNCIIAEKIRELAEEGGSILVLSDRLNHLKILKDLVNEPAYSVMVSGSASKSEKFKRLNAMEDMRQGMLRIMFATYALAKEGLDIPCLTSVVFAMPKTDPATITQACGRVSRVDGTKEFGLVYDFIDDHWLYRKMWDRRKSVYRSNGYEIY